MDILLGIIVGLIGLVVCFSGLRVFFYMLPIVGFVTGFFVGATMITGWFGDGFLSTVTGWVVGFALGVLFSVISYLWWYIGAIMAAGASGALLFSGIFSWMGMNSGILLVSFGIVGAVIFALGALVLNLPVYIVLVNTSIVGAYMVIGGLMLIFGRKTAESFDWGIARAAALDSWFWWIVLVVLVTMGIMSQLSKIAQIQLPEDKWVRAEPV